MFNFINVWRWCDDYGGGLVIADSEDDAREKLAKKYDDRDIDKIIIWLWTNDDYFDKQNPDVLDIYGG